MIKRIFFAEYPRVRFISLKKIIYLLFILSAFGLNKTFAQKHAKKEDRIKQDSVLRSSNRKIPYNYSNAYPILYDNQSENDLVGAIGYLKGQKLYTTPSAFISNALTGRIAGLYTHQASGEPGNDGVNISVRGMSPLVLVDGIPRSIYSINPEQVESITLLKDALSTAMLGMRGMNGAILITTRKGKYSPKFSLNLKAQKGVSTPLKLPQPLSAYEYGLLYNEALANNGISPLYSNETLEAYKNHSDPYNYPDINWYDKILKKQAAYSRYTLNASGSNKNMHYFVSMDYLDQEGLLKQSPVNNYSTNTTYKRFVFRSNINVNLTSRLNMFLNVFGRIRDQNEPGHGAAGIFNDMLTTPNNAYPIFNPDSSLGGNVNFNNNIYGQSVVSGYKKTIYSDGYVDIGLKRNLNDVLRGWWVQGIISYNMGMIQVLDRSKNFATYQMKISADGDTSYQQYSKKSIQNNSSSVSDRANQFYVRLSTGYTHQWDNDTLNILLLYNLDKYTENSFLPYQYNTFAGRVQYNIENKYILKAVASYGGDSRYKSGSRFGFFPAIGAAWNIQNEDFFNRDGFINKLKLRASYGLTGYSVPGQYKYIDRYGGATGYHFGTSASAVSGRAFEQPYGGDTYEKALKLDVGVDMAFFKRHGRLSVDYYRNKYKDLMETSVRTSAVIGWGDDIVENLGKDLYSGLEVTLGWSDEVSAFHYYISGNLTLSNSKVLFNDEPNYPYPWMQKTGQNVGQVFGYVADGFITQSGGGPVVAGYNSVSGDLKYKDLNNDGIINQFDKKPVGSTGPLIFYGFDFGFSWKGLSLSCLLQGVADKNIVLTGNREWAFQQNGKGQAYQHHLNRWTPETASSATYPRLSVGNNVNNEVVSSFWVRSGNYLRLKNIELSYAVFNDVDLAGKIKINQLRIFINGFNLLTTSDLKYSDPEVLAGSYPIQKVINGGVSIKF